MCLVVLSSSSKAKKDETCERGAPGMGKARERAREAGLVSGQWSVDGMQCKEGKEHTVVLLLTALHTAIGWYRYEERSKGFKAFHTTFESTSSSAETHRVETCGEVLRSQLPVLAREH